MRAKWTSCVVVLSVLIFSGSVFASDLIHTTDTLSQARYNLAATSVGDKAMFAGGYPYCNIVDIYDAGTGLWTTDTLSQARHDLAATTVGNKAMFAGGEYASNQHSDVVDIYDADTGLWSTDSLSQARSDPGAVAVESKVIIAGGWAGYGTNVNTVDIYDADTGLWTTDALPQGGGGTVATAVGNRAFFHSGYSNVVNIYDPETTLWTTATLSQQRDNLAAASVGTKALFAGGWSGTGASNVVDIYDAAMDQWTVAHLSSRRSYLAATTVGDFVLFAGGTDGATALNIVDVYDSRDGSWTTLTLSEARRLPAATTLGDTAFFGGGYIDDVGISNVVDIYTLPIQSINATYLDSAFTPTGGAYGIGELTVSDEADIVVETAAGQTTYDDGSVSMATSLFADNSAGGLASGLFRNGTLIFQDADGNDLLTGDLIELELCEVIDGAGLLAGQGLFEVTGGSLEEAFYLPYGEIVQITFEIDPADIDDFSGAFTGVSNITLTPVPEPATLGLLAVGAVALLKRKRKSCGIRRRRK